MGLSVALSGCSSQSTESMLQEVKMDAKDAKSGKATMVLSMKNENNSSADSSGYEVSGDEKFDPLELKMNGKFFQGDKSRDIKMGYIILKLIQVLKQFGIKKKSQRITDTHLTLRINQ